MRKIFLLLYLLTDLIVISEAEIIFTWTLWSSCYKDSASPDQNCHGIQTRQNVTNDTTTGTITRSNDLDTRQCLLTNDTIDGGYTLWSEWDDCSQRCKEKTYMRRECHNPTPCNGGKDCTSHIGVDELTKQCKPVAGQWGEWGAWGDCINPNSGKYGTGIYLRSRKCDSPVNICGGHYCKGENQTEGNCREVPPCLTYQMFSDKFLKIENAMSIYTSAQVDIYLLTKNNCTTATIIHTYFALYKITNITDNTEVQIGGNEISVKFKFNPGQHEIGYYRLYARIGYPASMTHWMEESMFVKIEQPPPHAFIKGGAGRTIGQGLSEFDARSVSYSLTKGPGDPSGLIFSWKCLNFVTNNIYNLLQFNIAPLSAFKDTGDYKKKWYETNFVPYIENNVAFIYASTLYTVIDSLQHSNSTCMNGSEFYVKAVLYKYPPTREQKDETTEAYENFSSTSISNTWNVSDVTTSIMTTLLTTVTQGEDTVSTLSNMTTIESITTTEGSTMTTMEAITTTEETTTPGPLYDLIALKRFFEIDFMYEMEANPISELDNITFVIHPDNNSLVLNEMLEFLNNLYNEESEAFLQDTDDFFERLSDSSLTLDSLYKLRELSGLPGSANATFFHNLKTWLQNANVSKQIAYNLRDLLDSFKHVQSNIKNATELVKLIGIEGYLKLVIDESGQCLMTYLVNIFNGFAEINSFNWHKMEQQEKYYLSWLEDDLVHSSACKMFNGIGDGTGSLNVTSQDVAEGMGFLVYLRVEFEESISYFIQHAQSVPGNPPVLEIECRLNCMKKTALTSIMSLKASCPFCTFEHQKGFKFWWKVKDFDIFSRISTTNDYWQSWMLSEADTNAFVMQANVLNASAGYLIEAHMQLATGERSMSIWSVNTNILPYGGSCEIEDDSWGEKKVTTNGWNDEGFRTSTDPSYDWKEQLMYRIVQTISEGKETLLYYGLEAENYIKVKPGIETDGYNVTIKIQIYDIFIDYTECTQHIGQVLPNYTTSDQNTVSSFLNLSAESVDYYWKTGNVKQVAMNAEVAGTPVTDLNSTTTIFDTEPGQWVNIGVEILPDGTNVTKTFDELWNMYQHPDYGEVNTQSDIIKQLTTFSTILAETSNAVDGTSTVNLDQVANSIGTIIGNKLFTANSSASKAFEGNKGLLEKLVKLTSNETYPKYEDYITTCQGMLRVLNNALEAILPKTSVDTPTTLDIYTIMSDISSRQELSEPNNADLTPAERAFIASQVAMKNALDADIKNDDVQNEVQVLLDSISYLGHVLQMLNYRKQMPVYVQNGHINSTEDKKLIGELIQKGFQINEVNLSFVESNSQSTQEQAIQVTLYDHTPFSWDEESKFISSKTVTVSVGEGHTTNSAIPSKIKLQNSGLVPTRKTIKVAIPVDKNETTSQMLVYKMYWKTPADSLIISINSPINHLNHTISIRKTEPPTEDEYDWKKVIESSDWLSTSEIKVILDGGLYTTPTNVYVGVLVQKETSSDPTLTRRRRSLRTTTVEYKIISATVGCRVWDTVEQKWDKTSCQLSSASTINKTVCECSNPPGNSFATTFYVPPNTIDFGSVFEKFDLKNNAAVFATVVSLVLLYILLCVWAFRQDRKDHTRWALSYLSDNGPYDDYLYILTVFTGLHRHAGTKSRIGFMIIDDKPKKSHFYEPDVRLLDDETHRGFDVGSIRKFVMSVAKPINDPTVLKIWHDNSGQGNSASWYLNKIILEDVQTSERYMFICDQWLSLDHDDGCVDCAIPVSDKLDKHKFSFLFNEQTRQNTTDNHLWLSVAIRPEDSNFTRIERLACCLTLLFLTMISNAMFYGQNTGSRISIGPIKLSLSGIYISLISAMIVAPPILLVSYMFRSSKPRSRNKKKTLTNTKENPGMTLKSDEEVNPNADVTDDTQFSLPFWCRYAAWGIVTLAVITSGFFLILYSMEWGKTKSEEWLICFFMSFIESMLLVDPLKIILMSVIFSWIVKSYKEKTVKYDREKLLLETKRRAASPLSYLLDVFKATQAPLKSQTVARLKEKRQQRLKMQEIFIELVLYMIFLAVLYCVSFSNRDSRWYNVKNHLEQQLVTSNSISVGGSTLKYDQVTTASNLYTWIDDTLIPFLFPRYDNNGDQLKANRRLYVQDQVNFRVGPMRLRQLRAAEEPCRTQFWGNFACYDEYSISGEDDGNYCVAWEPRPCVRGQNVYNMTYAAWNFVSSVDIWGLPATGLHSTYGGGGYIAEFIVNYNISRLVLNDLYKYTWIDRKTRAIFTEFTLYNVDDNVFVFISFLTEFPETGGVIASTLIKPFRPYQHVGSLGLFIFICEIIVLIGITVFSVHKYIWFRRYGKKMWKELWHVLDILIIILFIVATIMYIGRWIMINMAMKEWENHKNKFVNFSHIASWDELFNIFLAFIIFLTTIRIMRVLSYNKRINQFGKVLANVSRDLCGCFVMFMMVYVAFVTFGHLIFGRHLETYKNLFVSSTTLVNAIIGKNSIKDLFSVEPVLGRAYYFFFVLFLLWILMTMMNATLNVGITIVRKKPVRSTYGIINIVASFWREAVGHIIASNNTTTKDRLKLSRNYISSKTFTKTIVVTRQDETQQVDMVKPTEDLPKKKERARRIYQ